MLKTFVLIASLLFTSVAYAGPQVFRPTTKCTHCTDGWVLYSTCCDCEADCEGCWFWGECPHCGVLKDNRIVLPVGIRRTKYQVLQDDLKFFQQNRFQKMPN